MPSKVQIDLTLRKYIFPKEGSVLIRNGALFRGNTVYGLVRYNNNVAKKPQRWGKPIQMERAAI